ncbi:phosphonate C-P lyase system protein PhnL [Prosthecomicrobium pneumaticum]|uniref:Alpha-D-ribose 1-methylphosphonate 5-triphosphate synthase subunit PhnL n=1 Tax=Prosthecomicrobium pneumaticum TaxID=81895 RepID=A0A7W9FLM9_9HYPH|nr:phosphonate C-P lyase system protein PhnL [Prosthecomicrobium pneumaticum]MBB5752940.1 alpha-D-ribose 1-methylphosphonate 5-triphosphate synthase subunit PhnL [Prosthecomicrobium pneumaticum]
MTKSLITPRPATQSLVLENLGKSFTLHLRGGTRIDAVAGISFAAQPGDCIVLGGPSGAGKSSILKMIYGNYRADRGRILVAHEGAMVDVAAADPRTVLGLRARTLGYVSQFLRVIPRVSALDIVAAAAEGDRAEARDTAARHLALLNVPERLWSLPPATFSGGEQQRVNIARGLVADRPILLLDEPTASLDAANRDIVVRLIEEKKRAGVTMVGIFHDADVRDAVATRILDITPLDRIAA